MTSKTFVWLGALFISVIFAMPAFAQNLAPDLVKPYKTVGNVDLKLNIFQPIGRQSTDKAPAIIFFFGGGWSGGSPNQFYEQARFMADRGLVAISAEYRVKSQHHTTPFECVQDGKSAIRWVRSHADELGIDPNQIVASGGSAGGHVAACTGTIEGHDDEGDDLSVSSIPNAMILYNPVIDTTEKGYGMRKVGLDRATEISPCHHVRAGLVPTLLLHGTADTTVPFENAERFTRLMKEAGNRCELVSFEGQGHGFFIGVVFRPNTGDTNLYQGAMSASIEFLQSLGFIRIEPSGRTGGEKRGGEKRREKREGKTGTVNRFGRTLAVSDRGAGRSPAAKGCKQRVASDFDSIYLLADLACIYGCLSRINPIKT